MKVEIHEETLAHAAKVLAGIPGGVERTAYSSLKRAGEQAKTKAGQFAAARYQISKGTFMSNVSVTQKVSGGGGNISMELTYRGANLPLVQFKVKYSKNGLLSASVKDGGGVLKHAFIPTNATFGAFERKGTSRLPIEQKFGPSTAQMMADDTVKEQMEETITEVFDTRMDHEVARLLAAL